MLLVVAVAMNGEHVPAEGALGAVGGVVEDDECVRVASKCPRPPSAPHPFKTIQGMREPRRLDLQVFK